MKIFDFKDGKPDQEFLIRQIVPIFSEAMLEKND